MRGDRIIHTQLLMAQAFGALADQIAHSTGYVFSPVEELPTDPAPVEGTLMCLKENGTSKLMFYTGSIWKQVA